MRNDPAVVNRAFCQDVSRNGALRDDARTLLQLLSAVFGAIGVFAFWGTLRGAPSGRLASGVRRDPDFYQ